MADRADDIIDRRRLRRKLTFWRIVALGVIVLAIAAASSWLFRDMIGGPGANQIAKIKIEGTITEDEELLSVWNAQPRRRMKGVILRSIHLAARPPAVRRSTTQCVVLQLRAGVAQAGTLAASAGYMIATA